MNILLLVIYNRRQFSTEKGNEVWMGLEEERSTIKDECATAV